MNKFVIIPLLAAVFALSGCQTVSTTNTALAGVTQSEQFEKVCRVIPLAKTAFNIITTQVDVSDSVRRKVNTAYLSAVAVCNDRPENIGEALVTVAGLYRTILDSSEAVSDDVVTLVNNEGV